MTQFSGFIDSLRAKPGERIKIAPTLPERHEKTIIVDDCFLLLDDGGTSDRGDSFRNLIYYVCLWDRDRSKSIGFIRFYGGYCSINVHPTNQSYKQLGGYSYSKQSEIMSFLLTGVKLIKKEREKNLWDDLQL